ncbi:MAG: phospho-N-acetylmuramoyl-pentapeptide-transferase [Phycisphaerae bacterium]
MVYLVYTGLILRIVGAAVLSFFMVILMAPSLIRWLIRMKLGDRPEFGHTDLNELTRHKSNTPTMGGLLIVVAMFVSVMLFANLGNMYVRMALMCLIWLGGLGAVDDWIKLRHSAGKGSRDGLKSWEKILFQIGLAVLLAVAMHRYGSLSYTMTQTGRIENPPHLLYLPFKANPIQLVLLVYVFVVVLTMVGSSNAVNLTDGMDGLAAGCMVIVAGLFLILSWVTGNAPWARFFNMPSVPGSHEMTIVCASILGSCMGFLWYNSHPAQVFMGDTGSLPLGGIIGYVAVVTRTEVLLLLAGGVFVMEAGSVLLQVGWFKWTKRHGTLEGKRLFRCAPIHHHFHLGGWAEPKVVVRFWLLGIIFAALALATLKLR